MKRLELAQEIYDKQQMLQSSIDSSGYNICVHTHYYNGLVFSAWLHKEGHKLVPQFDSDLNLIQDNGYKGNIDEARAALKEFLEGEV